MPLNPPIGDWRDKTVWIVGASSGIGRATASLLHSQGARVIVSARSSEALEEFVAEHPGAVAGTAAPVLVCISLRRFMCQVLGWFG